MPLARYDFLRTKYGEELLIDLISLDDLRKYIRATPAHRLSYYDITIISQGQGSFVVDDHERKIEPGTIIFSSPGQIREWIVDDIPKGHALIFEEEFLCTFFNDAQFVQDLSYFNNYEQEPFIKLEAADLTLINKLLNDIMSEISSFKDNDKHVLRALLYQVLILLNRKFMSAHKISENRKMNRYVKGFIDMVDANHRTHRSVDHYAQQLNITSGHLNSLVKEYFGTNAKKYILKRNILEAKRLLRYSDMNVDGIAGSLNYENTNYFIRAFREHTGLTPLQFRRRENP